MGYLDKSTITVDAILTNRGRELLSRGTGAFTITKFAVADDEVDYGLYKVNHPLGSNYYGAVIENMPVLEATPDETQTMRYKLVTIPSGDITSLGGVVIPQIRSGNAGITPSGVTTLRFSTTAGENVLELTPTTTYTSDNVEVETGGYTLLLADSSLAKVTVEDPKTGLVAANDRGSIVANGRKFKITAENRTGKTTVTIFGVSSGAVYNFTLSTVASS